MPSRTMWSFGFLPQPLDPFLRVDALQHQAGGRADAAVLVGQQRPEQLDRRLDAGADQRLAGAAADQRVVVVQCLEQSVDSAVVARRDRSR